MGKVTVVGGKVEMKKPITYIGDPVFANNDWATIIEACQKNKVSDTWAVGDERSININGVTYNMQIIGKNHDDYADGSGKAPLTFQLKEVHSKTYSMGADNTWSTCDMRTVHLPNYFKEWLPTEVKNAIKSVKKKTTAGNSSTSVKTNNEDLFLLSEAEVFGKKVYAAAVEGSQYEYYKAGNSTIRYKDGDTWNWLLRSPMMNASSSYCMVGSDGVANTATASNVRGVSFAFCF